MTEPLLFSIISPLATKYLYSYAVVVSCSFVNESVLSSSLQFRHDWVLPEVVSPLEMVTHSFIMAPGYE